MMDLSGSDTQENTKQIVSYSALYLYIYIHTYIYDT